MPKVVDTLQADAVVDPSEDDSSVVSESPAIDDSAITDGPVNGSPEDDVSAIADSSDVSADTVAFTDVELQICVAEALGVDPDVPMTKQQLLGLDQLDCSGRGIYDITTLAELSNLTQLNLGNNEIWSLQPLAGLTKLTNLTKDRWSGTFTAICATTPLTLRQRPAKARTSRATS